MEASARSMEASARSAALRALPSPRRRRERQIVEAARRLFDERGLQDAPMEEIARQVGITRTLLYRLFESKEELFVLTVTSYLDEMTERGRAAIDTKATARERLRSSWHSFACFCLEYPAFLDCALSLMRRPAWDLRERVSDATWLCLGVSMSACLQVTIEIVEDGARSGEFTVEDPAKTVNYMYAQGLGLMHVARVGIGVGRTGSGLPKVFSVDRQSVVDFCVRSAMLAVGAA